MSRWAFAISHRIEDLPITLILGRLGTGARCPTYSLVRLVNAPGEGNGEEGVEEAHVRGSSESGGQ